MTAAGGAPGDRPRRRQLPPGAAPPVRSRPWPTNLLDGLTPPQEASVVHRGGPCSSWPGPDRARPGCSPGASPTSSPPGTPPVADPGHHLHQQGGRRDAPAGGRPGRAPGASGCGSPPSTPPACGSSGPTVTASATRARSPSTTTPTPGAWSRSSPASSTSTPRSSRPARSSARSVRPSPPAGPDRVPGCRLTIFDRRIADVFDLYQQRMVAANAMDFDDLLLNTVRLFRQHPDVLEHYRTRFTHILIDEYQDTNAVQNALAVLLAGGTATSWWWGTATSRSTASGGRTSPTSSTSSRPSPTPPPSPWTRTSGRPRPSSTRPTPSSPTTCPASRSRCGPTAAPGRRSSGTGPRTSTTRRSGWPTRSSACAAIRASGGGTWPSSTGPTPSPPPSRRPWSAPRFPTRWWEGPSSTTAARSRTSWPT